MRAGTLSLLAAALPAVAQLNLVGDAHMRGDTIRLTRARNDVGGAVWRVEKQPLARGFETVFDFQISKPGGLGKGADGFAFVIQNQGTNALAGLGGAGGFASADGVHGGDTPGIPYSLAIFFDTFKNPEGRDPSNNFLTVAVHGHPDDVKWPPARLALVKKLPFNLKDGKKHHARIAFQPPRLTVFLDKEKLPVLSTIVDLGTMLDTNGKAFIGFTASTGGGYANHDILNWDFRPDVSSTISVVDSHITFALGECLPNRNLCTPAQAAVNEASPGRFHVMLPAHLEGGASIPNPRAREAAISNAKGIVCLAANPAATPQCAGPSELLNARSANGRTYFEVRATAEAPLTQRQGFFEFDVELR